METERGLYDQESLYLAEHFLGDYPKATEDDKDSLATEIQDTIERWLVEHGFES